jgi:hypothetical protein
MTGCRSIVRLVFLWIFSGGAVAVSAASEAPVAWWRFESAADGAILEEVGRIDDSISGNFRLVEGVRGQALRLDGFTTVIKRRAAQAPRLKGSFTLDGWVAIAAYPWNWCPILAQEKEGKSGYTFGIGPQGHVGLRFAAGGKWLEVVSKSKLPLRSWSHVAAVYEMSSGIRLYIDGELAGELEVGEAIVAAPEADLLMGMNRTKVLPAHAVPPGAGTLPSWFSLDGILDEVRIFDRALLPEEIDETARIGRSSATPDIPPRVMPSGPPGSGPFGAYYARLKYYEEWDAHWRVADHPDVVVRFDDTPARVVFWRGLRYSPAWVTENGLWLADQSVEFWVNEGEGAEGCYEHMQDIHNRYSHVRIIASSPARAVVHWRYAPVSSRDTLWLAEEKTGWAWWVDEYYTFYPDGTGVRKVRWRQPDPAFDFPNLQIQETSVLCHPGQNPGEVLEHEALTLLNLRGESHTYSWPDDETPDTRERRNLPVDPSIIRNLEPDDPVIQIVNTRSENKPFVMFEPGNESTVYVGRVRSEGVHFPAYNHWPVCQVSSDGRFVQAADRATSFSISYHTPRRHEEDGKIRWAAMLYGATSGEAVDLVQLGKSWIHPPELQVLVGTVENRGYDVSQRAYVLGCSPEERCGDLSLNLDTGPDSPLVNACFVLENWGDSGAEVWLDGRRLKEGDGIRTAYERTLERTDLVLWLEKSSVEPSRIEIRSSR